MKYFYNIVLSALVSLLTIVGVQTYSPNFFQADVTELFHATKKIEIADLGHCSGTVIAPQYILTAAHCLPTDSTILKVDGFVVKPVKVDRARDLMLVKGKEINCPCIPIGIQPKQGQKVYTVGFPVGIGPLVTEGLTQGVQADVPEYEYIGMQIVSTPATFGNSGGGTFIRAHGHWFLIGVVSRTTVFPFDGMFPMAAMHIAHVASTQSILNFMGIK